MMQIARNVAAKLADEGIRAGKKPDQIEHVHVFSLEMTADAVITTSLASTSRWSADQIKSGDIDDWIAFEKASQKLAALPICIDDQGDMDMPGLGVRARALKRQRHTRLICVSLPGAYPTRPRPVGGCKIAGVGAVPGAGSAARVGTLPLVRTRTA
jgi:replicative DNA helicase